MIDFIFILDLPYPDELENIGENTTSSNQATSKSDVNVNKIDEELNMASGSSSSNTIENVKTPRKHSKKTQLLLM